MAERQARVNQVDSMQKVLHHIVLQTQPKLKTAVTTKPSKLKKGSKSAREESHSVKNERHEKKTHFSKDKRSRFKDQ